MRIYIGIDPGEHTGVAVWDAEAAKFIDIRTTALHKALTYVMDIYTTCTAECAQNGLKCVFRVYFEDARLRKWFRPEQSQSEYRGRLMGAGAAKRDARIWEEFLDDNHIPFTAVKPAAGATKWNADTWRNVTGWQGRTSEHARDASLLVYGRP